MAKRKSPALPAGFRNEALLELHYVFQEHLGNVYAWLCDPDRFAELRIKERDDGSVIVVAKGYSADGGPVVCFGSGYDAFSALQGLSGAMDANRWREDKPWQPGGGSE